MAITLSALRAQYLAQYDRAPAAIRTRRWALDDLAAFAAAHLDDPDPPATAALELTVLTAWVSQDQPISTARAKAGAGRALCTYAAAHHLIPAPAGRALALPTPVPPPTNLTAARHLLIATGAELPWGVPRQVWFRFCAHAHLLAATGAPEEVLAHLRTADIAAHAETVTAGADSPIPLEDHPRRALAAWLEVRTEAVTALQGSDPGALWIRLHPGTDRRTGRIAPAGLAISARGLRLAFTAVRDALAVEEPRLAHVTVRDMRALAHD